MIRQRLIHIEEIGPASFVSPYDVSARDITQSVLFPVAPVLASRTRSEKCSIPSQMTMLDFKLAKFGKIISWHCRASRSQRSRVMKKQRGVTQAEKEFDAEVAKFNQEARKIMDDRSLSMGARRRLINLKGKALLRPSASGSQSSSTG
jgi:hypothetical protein